jgi:competence protein ComEC
MGVLALVARERGRIYDMTNALAFAGVVMVLMNPYLLRFDLSFQLSFLATLGIVIVPISLERYTFWLPKWLSEIVLATLGAELFVMPLIVYYFGTIPLFGLFANVLILPTVSFLMLVTFLTGVMGLVSHFAAVITGFFVQIIAGYHLFVIHWFAKLPVLSAGPFIAALLALIPFLWTCFYLRRRFRPQLPAVN